VVLVAKSLFKGAQLLLQSFTIFNVTICVLWPSWKFAHITFTFAVQWLVDAVVVLKLIQVDVVQWENFLARTARNIRCTCALHMINHIFWKLPSCLVRGHVRNWFLLHGRQFVLRVRVFKSYRDIFTHVSFSQEILAILGRLIIMLPRRNNWRI
jgi:hypothetical protein